MEYMNLWKIFGITFISIFLAELGDKTQLATMAFASNNPGSKTAVFLGAAIALVLTSFIGVILGGYISKYIPADTIKIISGILFICIGIFIIISAYPSKAKAYQKVINKIEEIRKNEICSNCLKFNEYLEKLQEGDMNIDLPDEVKKIALKEPCGRADCSTEELKNYIKKALDIKDN